MDMQKIPPIHQKRIVTFVNFFIIDTVAFLNKFINSSQTTLWKLEKRMQKLETSLKLLEIKLNFVPDLEEMCSTSNQLPETTTSLVIEDTEDSNKIHDEEETAKIKTEVNIPPEIQKYFKMMEVGVPVDAVKLKMQREGYDPHLLNQV